MASRFSYRHEEAVTAAAPRAAAKLAALLALLLPAACSRQPSSASTPRPVDLTTPAGVPMVLVPAGRFRMGSDAGKSDEKPIHEVTVQAFLIDKFEVTQDQFAALEVPNPSHFQDPRRPVEQVRWSDAALFCNERSRKDGLAPCYDETTFACNFEATGYRLPTEAEWEYAARAGTAAEYPFGDSPRKLAAYACFAASSTKKTEPAGRRRPNPWGIHNMLGNVSEWCNDVYSPTFYAASPSDSPRGAGKGLRRVLRGGSWKLKAPACRVAARHADNPGITDACFARDSYGFRCVRRPTGEEAARLARTSSGSSHTR